MSDDPSSRLIQELAADLDPVDRFPPLRVAVAPVMLLQRVLQQLQQCR